MLGVWILVGEARDPSTWMVWLPVLGVVGWAGLGSCCDVSLVHLSTSSVPFWAIAGFGECTPAPVSLFVFSTLGGARRLLLGELCVPGPWAGTAASFLGPYSPHLESFLHWGSGLQETPSLLQDGDCFSISLLFGDDLGSVIS